MSLHREDVLWSSAIYSNGEEDDTGRSSSRNVSSSVKNAFEELLGSELLDSFRDYESQFGSNCMFENELAASPGIMSTPPWNNEVDTDSDYASLSGSGSSGVCNNLIGEFGDRDFDVIPIQIKEEITEDNGLSFPRVNIQGVGLHDGQGFRFPIKLEIEERAMLSPETLSYVDNTETTIQRSECQYARGNIPEVQLQLPVPAYSTPNLAENTAQVFYANPFYGEQHRFIKPSSNKEGRKLPKRRKQELKSRNVDIFPIPTQKPQRFGRVKQKQEKIVITRTQKMGFMNEATKAPVVSALRNEHNDGGWASSSLQVQRAAVAAMYSDNGMQVQTQFMSIKQENLSPTPGPSQAYSSELDLKRKGSRKKPVKRLSIKDTQGIHMYDLSEAQRLQFNIDEARAHRARNTKLFHDRQKRKIRLNERIFSHLLGFPDVWASITKDAQLFREIRELYPNLCHMTIMEHCKSKMK